MAWQHFRNKRYDHSGYRRIRDVIPDSFTDSLNLDSKKLRERKYYLGRRTNQHALMRKVFIDFLKLMIDDCIENNNKFLSPNYNYFFIYIREKREYDCKKIMNKIHNAYTNVDLIKSDGKLYEFVLYSKFLHPKWFRQIRISHYKYMELIEKVNQGKRYFKK